MRRWSLLRSAARRALEGITAKAAVVVGVLTTLGGAALGVIAARTGGGEVDRVAALVAALQGWGAGVLLCFAASLRAFDRDREEGWGAWVGRSGARAGAYLGARISALALATLVITAGGTFVAGAAALVSTRSGHDAWLAVRGLLAGLAYATAFAGVVAPVAMATLGPRGRASGYLYLLAVLVVPALVSPWTSQVVPEDWAELVSIPGALDALRDALLGSADAAQFVRALIVLIAVSGLAVLWARAQLVMRMTASAADRVST